MPANKSRAIWCEVLPLGEARKPRQDTLFDSVIDFKPWKITMCIKNIALESGSVLLLDKFQ